MASPFSMVHPCPPTDQGGQIHTGSTARGRYLSKSLPLDQYCPRTTPAPCGVRARARGPWHVLRPHLPASTHPVGLALCLLLGTACTRPRLAAHLGLLPVALSRCRLPRWLPRHCPTPYFPTTRVGGSSRITHGLPARGSVFDTQPSLRILTMSAYVVGDARHGAALACPPIFGNDRVCDFPTGLRDWGRVTDVRQTVATSRKGRAGLARFHGKRAEGGWMALHWWRGTDRQGSRQDAPFPEAAGTMVWTQSIGS
ncbi:hypothetical protein F5144DRAFT_5806 [Chaetomium tenue]|uniref:Uncharacterized protein n=1 Tax=Chaetomium tenue TaxID=1854479 RepID=A0ACB7PKQ7_9PEZI|nr:hypothetical protein F5144DRAFT_5806 [Chaetomium globosum]